MDDESNSFNAKENPGFLKVGWCDIVDAALRYTSIIFGEDQASTVSSETKRIGKHILNRRRAKFSFRDQTGFFNWV